MKGALVYGALFLLLIVLLMGSTAQAQEPVMCEHESAIFHELYDAEQDCWYDHFHGDDPAEADAVFGRDWLNVVMLNEIDPVHNPEPGDNAHHKFMTWMVRTGLECTPTFGVGCVTDFRALAHYLPSHEDAIGINPDGSLHTTEHTALLEARVCLPADVSGTGEMECGIVHIAGNKYLGDVIVDNQTAIDFPDAREAWGVRTPRGAFLSYCNVGIEDYQVWYPVHPLFRIGMEVADSWTSGCSIDPRNPIFIPGNNASSIQPHIIAVDLPTRLRRTLDPDNNAVVDWRGYINRHGVIQAGCTGTSIDCLPLWYESVPWPPAQAGLNGYQVRGEYREYDQSIGVLPMSPIVYPLAGE